MRESWTKCLCLAFFWFTLVGLSLAAPGKALIQAAYQKSGEGAKLKFVDGMLWARASGYTAYAMDGKRMDLSNERERFQKLFSQALRVRLTFRLLKCQEVSPTENTCLVESELQLERMDPVAHAPRTLVISTRSSDDWVQSKVGWRLKTSHIQWQRYTEQKLLVE